MLRASLLQTVDGTRGRQVLHVPHIPLTPGPLVVVIKVASSQVANASGYWPPSLPDSVETIAASCAPLAHLRLSCLLSCRLGFSTSA